MSSASGRVFIARLAGTKVFDPLGDLVGRVRDVVVTLRQHGNPRAVGLVVEVAGRKRVFLPLTRVTSIAPGQVISTGLLNMRRFEQRPMETLAIGELLDREVQLTDGSGKATIEDLAMEQSRMRDWEITKLSLRRDAPTGGGLVLRRRGETWVADVSDVLALTRTGAEQSAKTLLATYEELKPADLADVLHELDDTRRLEVATAMDDERLADVLEELPDDDRVDILTRLKVDRAADVLEAMQPDDAADLLHEMPDAQAAQLLALMEPEEAKDVRLLLSYDEKTAGGLMTTEPVIVSPETSIATGLARIRRADVPPALAATIFVVRPPVETPTGRFLGVVHFQRMLREPPHGAIGTIVDSDIEPVDPHTSLSEIARQLATYNLLALPVVDEDRHLLGAVSIDDVLDHMLPEDWRGTDDSKTQGDANHG
ncbi:magnesium transporter MgtE N-terminal domain-containing protein [Rarobacter incanus]|uniref:Mg/Co/Ni transporter MgtE n=1 Tax=Rarobacter incanus TaxID=153494 RepID=A0A542SRC7_9MICO|nr:CBS domain-containing protein [Rarobacter incanus]TQK77155.1 Mg/Co/Ni transporter MgtE [Rarobacter incanus]